jgi:hypothetical protein
MMMSISNQNIWEMESFRRGKSRSRALASLAILGVLGGLFLLGFGGLAMASAVTGPSFNNIQISLQAQNSTDNYFAVDVYNSTGGLVASSQSQYPAFSFELPSASYIFAATSLYSSSTYTGYYGAQDMEYGYQSLAVSSSSSITITTQKLSSITSTRISIQVNFPNGTAAKGAAVSAQALGSYYYWGSNFNMWNQTNSSGVAVLTVPNVPVEVNSYDWVYVNIPSSVTTIQTTVAGQPINVTVYYEPMYVPFSGSTLIIPPQTSGQITLKYTPYQNYCYPVEYGASASAANAPAQGKASTSSSGAAIVPCYFYGSGTAQSPTSASPSGSGAGQSGIAASPQLGINNQAASPSLLPSNQAPQQSLGGASNLGASSNPLDTEIEVGAAIAVGVSVIGAFAFFMVRKMQKLKGTL